MTSLQPPQLPRNDKGVFFLCGRALVSKRGGAAELLARESSCIDSLLADRLSPLSETEVWASVTLLQQPRAPEQQTSEGGAH